VSDEPLPADLVALRRAIHREPEVGLELPLTRQKILGGLSGLPLEIIPGRRLSSVTAVLRGAHPGPAVLLRADMDALPGRETSGEPFSSRDENTVHSCGHDLHVAALVGAARLLARRRERLHGDVVLMFQPGEEGYGGAALMVSEGVLDAAGSRVVAAYGLHVLSSVLPQGWIATRCGPLLAAADLVRVTVHGRSGHGSQPHLARDPVVGAAAMVLALQSIVTREFDVFDPVVLNVGVFHAGTHHNAVPDRASFEISVRSFSAAARDRVLSGIHRTVAGLASGYGLHAEIAHEELFPVTVTDPAETAFVLQAARAAVGAERVVELPNPVTASEDFSLLLREVPGAFFFLGACPAGADPAKAPVNHAADAAFDDAVLPQAAALLADLAERRLSAS
jgi:hippurate hydrolase